MQASRRRARDRHVPTRRRSPTRHEGDSARRTRGAGWHRGRAHRARLRRRPPAASIAARHARGGLARRRAQRHGPLIWLALVFAVTVLVAGRIRGARALAGLAASLGMVVFFIVPAIPTGRPPVQVAAFGALGVMLLDDPARARRRCEVTRRVHRHRARAPPDARARGRVHLVGPLERPDERQAVYLQSTTHVSIRGLLLAGMVIGSLGVLGDTTVTQASTVMALRGAQPELGWRGLAGHATSRRTRPHRRDGQHARARLHRRRAAAARDLQPRRHLVRQRDQQRVRRRGRSWRRWSDRSA